MLLGLRRGAGRTIAAALIATAAIGVSAPVQAQAQISPFMSAIAQAAALESEVSAFYKANGYEPIWVGEDAESKARRAALLGALRRAGDHALPVDSYRLEALEAAMRNITTQRDLGRVEVMLSKTFLKYAHDVSTGILDPADIDPGIARDVPRRDGEELLRSFAAANPTEFLRSLPPQFPEYTRLQKARIELQKQLADGGWGPTVPAYSLKPGDRGQAVVAMRNRLIAMGYMERSASMVYDAALQEAVQLFQHDMGLNTDGVAGRTTMQELNVQIEDRLPSLLVAMERERWMNIPRGERHVWVNLVDFTAAIVDHGEVTFRTRSVIGANSHDRRSVEFSDMMEYMEINPYWNVPRSIAVNEYLPGMIASGGAAAGHLQLVAGGGQVVPRGAVNWGAYSPRNFPFNLRQPPSRGNALGLVKFMFPNQYNIYLHDTPSKSLFLRDRRDFSHGCIRLQDPFEFAYHLLEPQEENPKEFFHRILNTGQNTQVPLEEPIPVHLVYRTAYTSPKGRLNFRHDVYGRDGKIFDALLRSGVSLNAYGT
ncbi:L,D-transpeptidase family protein [Psychromarinibacter sp. C21-152]|uniref:L,D-transpeptidase family protein n=1 Tax=Psychromarinibacter sediminicola TaxID=3033385 RepID=A0AAE3NRW2_9RHOB|nr:L,D-transpeptidase family protein [Psychromarinibacter sediminicola]MDF0602383.1 L,D-transpeptidase family protein [Psychromarinibacter sediminicola]